jgi:cytosolic carboxypeptidase protein 2/3
MKSKKRCQEEERTN